MLIVENPFYGTKFEVAESDCDARRDFSSRNVFNFYGARDACKSVGRGWRLPKKVELDLMYHQLHLKGIGNFIESYYWSKSINNDNKKERWCYNFADGSFVLADSYYKLTHSHLYVRAVRTLLE
jgi:hypothetical protein